MRRSSWKTTTMDADIAAYLRALAERVHRNVPQRRDPERFYVDKACITASSKQDRALASRLGMKWIAASVIVAEKAARHLRLSIVLPALW
jgi:hypothetical protein